MQVLGVPSWKKAIFSLYGLLFVCFFVVVELFFEVALFLETCYVLKTPGCMPGQPP